MITEITNESWFSRIKESIKGILFGFILFIAAFPLLFWNEGRAIKTAKSLEEGAASVISVEASTVDPANQGKLIHITGKADTQEVLEDATFGIKENAIKLNRTVEMYQWQENKRSSTEKDLGGTTTTKTTYSYEKTWSSQVISSSNFKESGHENPSSKSYLGRLFNDKSDKANKVNVEAFQLSHRFINKIGNAQNLAIQASDIDKLDPILRHSAQVVNGMYYLGDTPNRPQIGDLRVRFSVVKPSVVSIIAQQKGNSFMPYKTKVGREIELLYMGEYTAQAMFEQEMTDNTILTWVLRFVGFLVMTFGLSLIFKPLSVLGDVLPFIGDILGAGIGLIAGVVSAVLSLITIAIAWFFYRPILSLVLIAISVGIGYLLKTVKKPARTEVNPQANPTPPPPPAM